MNLRKVALLFTGVCLAVGTTTSLSAQDDAGKKKTKKEKTAPSSVHDFKLKSIDGKALPLRKFRDQVLMVVNVASK